MPRHATAMVSLESLESAIAPRLVQLIRERGWRSLTRIQADAFEAVRRGMNIVITAPTGYGKTEAALLPVFDAIIRGRVEVKPITILYITPLRALINDLYHRISWWVKRLGLRVARKHGDVPHIERARRLRHAPHMLITTPESLEIDLDWAHKFRKYYANVKWVVVDEVHELVSSRRGAQLAILLERLRRIAGDYQLILLSATTGDPELVGKVFSGSSARKLAVVQLSEKKPVEVTIEYCELSGEQGWNRVAEKLKQHIEPLTLIFVNSKYVAERLHEALRKATDYRVAVHHASMSAAVKEEIERKAKTGGLDVIICTKTLELGIDIGVVKKVILFRPTGTVASLLQRLGRSGHEIGGVTRGVVVATDAADLVEAVAEARLAVRGVVERPQPLSCPLDVMARSIVGMALSGEYTVDEARDILSRVYYFSSCIDDELFKTVIGKLADNKLIRIDEEGRVTAGPSFYRIWRFESVSRRWWEKSFTEFFTLIGGRDTFTVRSKSGKLVGELDTEYVLTSLRIGAVIKLGGRTWRVVGVDEVTQTITVEEAPNQTPTIPYWRGEGPEVSSLVAGECRRVLKELVADRLALPSSIMLTGSAAAKLRELRERIIKYRTVVPDEDTVIVEQLNDEVVFIMPSAKRLIRTLAYALLAEASKANIDTHVRIAYQGFSIKPPMGYDPVADMLSLTPDELVARIRAIVPRTSYFLKVVKNYQLAFAILRKFTHNEGRLYEEAVEQTIREYFDVEGALKFIEGLRGGSKRIIPNRGAALFYTLDLLHNAPEKLWSLDVDEILAEVMEGLAFTVEELADATGLPEKTIESKLKEMRKPGHRHRVFQFIDVDTGEWRWALVKDAERVASSEEFASSFQPLRGEGLYMVLVKTKDGGLYHVTVTPRELMDNPGILEEKIPIDEVYEVKVIPLTAYDDTAIKYYHVPAKLLGLITLNAISILQRIENSNPY